VLGIKWYQFVSNKFGGQLDDSPYLDHPSTASLSIWAHSTTGWQCWC